MRERQLNIRLSEDEAARLDALADHYGINVAAVIRMLAKREADALGLAQGRPAPTPKKTRK